MEFAQPVNYVLGPSINTSTAVQFSTHSPRFSVGTSHRTMISHFEKKNEDSLREIQETPAAKHAKLTDVNSVNEATDNGKYIADDDFDSSDEDGLVIDEDYMYVLDKDIAKCNKADVKKNVDDRLSWSDKENNNEIKTITDTEDTRSMSPPSYKFIPNQDYDEGDNSDATDKLYDADGPLPDVKVSGARKRKSTNVERAITNLSQLQEVLCAQNRPLTSNSKVNFATTDLKATTNVTCNVYTTNALPERPESLEENTEDSNHSGEHLPLTSTPRTETCFKPVKTNRRKKSIPAKCSTIERKSVSPNFQTNIYDQSLLDLSVESKDRNSPDYSNQLSKNVDGPVDLTAPKARETLPPSAEAVTDCDAPLDLSMKTMQAKTHVKKEVSEELTKPEAEFFEWLSNNRSKQLMQANVLQYHMWMKNASMRTQPTGWPNQSISQMTNSVNPMSSSVPPSPIHPMTGYEVMTQAGSFPSGSSNGSAYPMSPMQMPPFNVTRKFDQKPRRRKRKNTFSEGSPESESSKESGNVSLGEPEVVVDAPELVKDGDSMKYYVTDAKQVQVVIGDLIEASTLAVTEGGDLEAEGEGRKVTYICQLCRCQFFHVEHLTKHIKSEHILKKFKCEKCDKSFSDAGNYRQHMRVHDETDIPFECHECHRRFRHKCTLKVHLRIHTGERPFQCQICFASFKISSGLQSHMRKHTGETPYACEFCDLRFKCQSNLKQHMFQHTQARPFTCDVCGKSYSRKSIRDAHMATHREKMDTSGMMLPVFPVQ